MIKSVTLSMEEYESLVDKNNVKDAKIKELEDSKNAIIYYSPESGVFFRVAERYVLRTHDDVISELINKLDKANELISNLYDDIRKLRDEDWQLKRRSLMQRILNK